MHIAKRKHSKNHQEIYFCPFITHVHLLSISKHSVLLFLNNYSNYHSRYIYIYKRKNTFQGKGITDYYWWDPRSRCILDPNFWFTKRNKKYERRFPSINAHASLIWVVRSQGRSFLLPHFVILLDFFFLILFLYCINHFIIITINTDTLSKIFLLLNKFF